MSNRTTGPDGFEQVQQMFSGALKAPIGELMNFRLIELTRGHAVFEGRPDMSVYNPIGSVHGGYAATLLDSACGVATHSMLGPGRGYATLELKVSYLRGLSADSGVVKATGEVCSMGNRVAFAEARLHDEAGKLCATATSTLLVFDVDAARCRTVPPGVPGSRS